MIFKLWVSSYMSENFFLWTCGGGGHLFFFFGNHIAIVPWEKMWKRYIAASLFIHSFCPDDVFACCRCLWRRSLQLYIFDSEVLLDFGIIIKSVQWSKLLRVCVRTCLVTQSCPTLCDPESRQIGSGQTRDGKSECRHSRNQRTKMDWNGWI